MNDGNWLYTQLKDSKLSLCEYDSTANSGTGGFDSVDWATGDSSIMEVKDESETAAIKTKYENELAELQSEDKRFDLTLKQIDTEHEALTTQYDSAKKVLDKNIKPCIMIKC